MMNYKLTSQFRLNHLLPFGVKSMRYLRYMVLILLLTVTENLCLAAGPVKPNTPVKVLTANFTSPFNGKDLTGWYYRSKKQEETVFESFDGKNESTDGRFTGRDGILTVNPWDEAKGPHYVSIWTREDYQGDFIFTIEFRAGVNADSGIFLRGTQLQCRDYLVAGPYKDLKHYKPQDWNKIEVVVKDNIAHCTCNGEILEDALKIPVTGPMGLEADRGQMEYRNILIKALN